MATLPAYNPKIPYLGLIPGGLRNGTMFRINGTMPYGGNRFTINLQTGGATCPRDDTALHLSVQPFNAVIVRNHCENKNWGPEEHFGGCPIQPGQPFEIIILAESTAFKVAINGIHFCHFYHRFSMYRVSFLAVESDVTITSITLSTDTPSAPSIPPSMPVIPIQPYQPNFSSPYPGYGHPHHPNYSHYPGHNGYHTNLPGYFAGSPPPYSPSPYPGHRHPYTQPLNGRDTTAYSLANDPAYLKRNKKNKAIKYGATAAGIGAGAAGIGLTAFALSRMFDGSDNADNADNGFGDDVGDGGYEF